MRFFQLVAFSLLIFQVSVNTAQADIAVSMGEQKARPVEDNAKGRLLRFLFDQGTGGPGHSTLYVSDLCLDGSFFKVRMCNGTEKDPGVYLSFISGLSNNRSWIAMSPNLYLYGVLDAADIPVFSTTFNSRLFRLRNDKRPEEIKTTFFRDDLESARESVLDSVRRKYFLGKPELIEATDGSVDAADKVNIFVTSERDVYNITIHGDTRAEAKILLDRLNSRENTVVKRADNQPIEGGYTWRGNCTKKINDWLVDIYGSQIGVNASLFEATLENPRHYAKGLLGKLAKMRRKGTLQHPVSIQYIPKISSDRGHSLGFGSPAQNLYDPRTIGGFFMWYGPAPIAGFFAIMNLPNITARLQRSYKNSPTLEIAEKIEELEGLKGNDAETKAKKSALKEDIKTLRQNWLGSKEDWSALSGRLSEIFAAVKSKAELPQELQSVLQSHTAKAGDFSNEVTRMMLYRSHGEVLKDGTHQLSFAFKNIEGSKRTSDEAVVRKTGLSASALLEGDYTLALMLTLATVDGHLAAKMKDRPDYAAMLKNFELLEKVMARSQVNQ
jgi:hypothetical protein